MHFIHHSAGEVLGFHPIIMQVSQAFAEMIFKHGFVHCDPHAGNMMVRSLPSSKWNIFGEKFSELFLNDANPFFYHILLNPT